MKTAKSYQSSARVVDGTLILSLPDAVSPIVWRMDLGHAKSSALEVRDDGKGGASLVLKTPRGDIHDIAPFAHRDQAIRALMAVSRALEQPQGKIRSATAANDESKAVERKSVAGKWLTGLAAFAVLGLMIAFLLNYAPKSQTFDTASAANAATQMDGFAPASGTPGVPVSADDFLLSKP